MLIELLFVLAAIVVGARLGGMGLGVTGGAGVAVLVFLFGLEPTSPPVDVMLMIAAVIAAASAMQAAGGLDYLVALAERLLRRHPSHITLVSPLVTYTFTLFAGTGHVAYSVLPVIAEVSRQTGIRPERPLGISVIASQQAITASPISAATVALLGLLSASGVTLFDILAISIPATLAGVLAGAFLSRRVGRELTEDPVYLARLEKGMERENSRPVNSIRSLQRARLSVILFLLAAVAVVLFGSVPSLRPAWEGNPLAMPPLIEIIMLTASALILLLCRVDGIAPTRGSIFIAGMQAVVAIFGIAWMGDTFINGNLDELTASVRGFVETMPWLFAVALFAMSVLLYSQAATIRAVMPLGIALGIAPLTLVALFPAVNGYFFIPNYPTIVAAINFDRTGTTRIGRWVLNHSFMMPGLVATSVAVAVGLLFASLY
ncbi:MAG: anaerobic C4-dicarboxylate transporter [Clostridium sp.]|nr:anaerobic C4-dicarboxylate transporter [Clostridium sp.]